MFQKALNQIRREKPLILNITNDVTMDFIANGLLSVGASPIMSKAKEEMDDLIKISNAVIINLGTLDEKFIDLCHHVCNIAQRENKPLILDPVGAGATRFRTATSLSLLRQYPFSILRGNASEIMSLIDSSNTTKGVDSSTTSEDAIESAKLLSLQQNIAIVISGETDIVIDQNQIHQSSHGSFLMPLVTGTGCLLSAIVGAFHAVEKNRFEASRQTIIFYTLCGENAGKKVTTPAAFKIQFIDEMYMEFSSALCHASMP